MKIIFLGGQGSGKSTQAKLISRHLKLPLIEMGQLMRNKARQNDQEAAQVKEALKSGHLVKDEIVIRTLHERIKKNDCRPGFVLDGFPRNNAQLQGLPKDIDRIYYVKVSDKEAIKRLKIRKRSDDRKEALTKRLEIYHKETEPLLDGFRNRGILDEIDGERSIEAIHKDVLKKVEKIRNKTNG